MRRFVEESFEKLVGDPEAALRTSLAVHEMLENAAKYAVGDQADLSVHFALNGPAATISLTNQTTPEHIARLRACIDEIQASTEPFVLYQTLMRRALGAQEQSSLGLARICAEGELELSLETEGSMVTISASCLPSRRHSHD